MPVVPPAVTLHHRLDGPADAPVLVLSNSLGSDLSMWEEQMPVLSARFRVLRYDTRGHGASSVPPGPYRIDQLGQDVIRLLDELRIERVHFCGLSMGGLTGLWLAAHQSARIGRLVICNSAARVGSDAIWSKRIEQVRKDGMAAMADVIVPRWFSAAFYAAQPARMAQLKAVFGATSADGYVANCHALAAADLRPALATIHAPTLVIGGDHDLSTPPELSHELQAGIVGARAVILDAGHLSNIEQPARFTAELLAHVSAPSPRD